LISNSFIPGQVSRKILVVDDEPLIRDFLYEALKSKGYTVITANNGQEALGILEHNIISAVITDIEMPQMDGAALLKKVRKLFPEIPVVVITGYGTVNNAVEVMRQGAAYYFPKPFPVAELHKVIQESIPESFDGERNFRNIITADPQMLQILEAVDTIAKSKASVLIQGESGTGKELIARAIHERSDRCNGPFVAVNCAAVTENLIEDEMFGHEPGAFTGAAGRRIGKFEFANGGTLLLDEIAEMHPSQQVKLLRVLQENEINRIGSNAYIKVDARIVATTNKDIKEEIKKGRFRDDLFYRLCVVPITLPSLRDREGDIALLVDYFFDRFARQNGKRSLRISEEAMDALETYTWPGNVRELENIVERAVMLCRSDILSVQNFFPDNPSVDSSEPMLELIGPTLYDAERYLIMSTLKKVDGNRTRAAEILGITTRTIRNKLQQYLMEHEEMEI